MQNELIFLLQTCLVAASTIAALALGREVLVSLICIQTLLANLFIAKQICLCSFFTTSTDVFSIGTILGLNLLQEYFGIKAARKAIVSSFFVALFFTLVSMLFVQYAPCIHDKAHFHFAAILVPLPRLLITSLIVFGIIELIDTTFFAYLKRLMGTSNFALRAGISLIGSQLLDTVLFSFLALYGTVASIADIIMFSYAIKLVAIACSTPWLILVKRIIPLPPKENQ